MLSTPPQLLRPKFKRPYIGESEEEEDFVPAKLQFTSPVSDNDTRSGLDGGRRIADTFSAIEVSQIWDSLFYEIPDSQMLILSESTQTQVILKWGTEEGVKSTRVA